MSESPADPPRHFVAPGEAPPLVPSAPREDELPSVFTANAPPSQVDEKKSFLVLLILVAVMGTSLYLAHWNPIPTATAPSTQPAPPSATQSSR